MGRHIWYTWSAWVFDTNPRHSVCMPTFAEAFFLYVSAISSTPRWVDSGKSSFFFGLSAIEVQILIHHPPSRMFIQGLDKAPCCFFETLVCDLDPSP